MSRCRAAITRGTALAGADASRGETTAMKAQSRCFSSTPKLSSRTKFQDFNKEPLKRPSDYQRSQNIRGLEHLHSGFYLPFDDYHWMRPRHQQQTSSSTLGWYTQVGMRSLKMTRSKAWNWYQNALGTVQYLDGFDFPELQDPDDMLPESRAEEEVNGRVPIVASGRAREMAIALEALRTKEGCTAEDVEAFINTKITWSDAEGVEVGSPSDTLHNQPPAVFEVLLLLCARHRDWVNVTALLREMGQRKVPLRSVVAAALFEYVDNTQLAMGLFETLKKENVKLHLHAYYALMRGVERMEEKDEAASHAAQWLETGTVSAEMVDFIVGGKDDSIFPELGSTATSIHGKDPKEEVSRAIEDLLREDREVIHTPAAPPSSLKKKETMYRVTMR